MESVIMPVYKTNKKDKKKGKKFKTVYDGKTTYFDKRTKAVAASRKYKKK